MCLLFLSCFSNHLKQANLMVLFVVFSKVGLMGNALGLHQKIRATRGTLKWMAASLCLKRKWMVGFFFWFPFGIPCFQGLLLLVSGSAWCFLTSSNSCWQTLHEGMCHEKYRFFVRFLLTATSLVDLLQLRKICLNQICLKSLTNNIRNVEPRMRAIFSHE